MAFHVEIRSGGQHARVFNLDVEELRERVLAPWLAERVIDLGDQRWDPRDGRLTVLEGPALDQPDLAVGQGWSNALRRRSRDVTVSALEAVREGAAALPPARLPRGSTGLVPVTVIAAPTDAARSSASRITQALGLHPESWGAVRARLLAAGAVLAAGPGAAAAVLAVLDGAPDPTTAFDLGLALGAFGGGVVVAATAAPGLSGLATIDLADPDAVVAIGARLRLAGALA
jgi:hypothetical protein